MNHRPQRSSSPGRTRAPSPRPCAVRSEIRQRVFRAAGRSNPCRPSSCPRRSRGRQSRAPSPTAARRCDSCPASSCARRRGHGRRPARNVDRAVVVEARRRKSGPRDWTISNAAGAGSLARVAAQHAPRPFVVRIDPGHGPFAVDLFQPQIRIGCVRGREASRALRGGRGGMEVWAMAALRKGGGSEKRGERGGTASGLVPG